MHDGIHSQSHYYMLLRLLLLDYVPILALFANALRCESFAFVRFSTVLNDSAGNFNPESAYPTAVAIEILITNMI